MGFAESLIIASSVALKTAKVAIYGTAEYQMDQLGKRYRAEIEGDLRSKRIEGLTREMRSDDTVRKYIDRALSAGMSDAIRQYREQLRSAFLRRPKAGTPKVPLPSWQTPELVASLKDQKRAILHDFSVGAVSNELISKLTGEFRKEADSIIDHARNEEQPTEGLMGTADRFVDALAQFKLTGAEISKIRRARKSVLAAVERNLGEEFHKRLERQRTMWLPGLMRDYREHVAEPKTIVKLFREGKEIGLEELEPGYVSGDLHFEDQLIYGVTLTVRNDASLYFRPALPEEGGMLRDLREWQVREPNEKPIDYSLGVQS